MIVVDRERNVVIQKTEDPRYELITLSAEKADCLPAKQVPQMLGWVTIAVDEQKHERLAERWSHAIALLQDAVVIRRRLRSGVPCLAGTRLTLAQIIAQLGEGDSIDDLAEDMEIDRGMLEKFLNGLALVLDRPAT